MLALGGARALACACRVFDQYSPFAKLPHPLTREQSLSHVELVTGTMA